MEAKVCKEDLDEKNRQIKKAKEELEVANEEVETQKVCIQ